MVDAGRDLWRSPCSAPMLSWDHLGPLAQDDVQIGFESLQEWRLHSLPGQPVPVLGHPHREKVLLDVWRKSPACPSPGFLYDIYFRRPNKPSLSFGAFDHIEVFMLKLTLDHSLL